MTSTYQYDGLNIIREILSGAEVSYLRGLNIDEPLTSTDMSTTTVLGYLAEGLGSAVALTDPAGALATTYTYEPFGRTAVAGAASTNPLQFTGPPPGRNHGPRLRGLPVRLSRAPQPDDSRGPAPRGVRL